MHFRSNDMSSVEDQSRGTALSPTLSLSLLSLTFLLSLSPQLAEALVEGIARALSTRQSSIGS